MFDIIPATLKEKRVNWEGMEYEEIIRKLDISGHCSAIVKISDDLSDLLAGHSSWFTYSAMNRIFKRYEFYF